MLAWSPRDDAPWNEVARNRSMHRRVSSSSGLAAPVTFGCVPAAGCSSGHRVTAATSGSNTPVIANHQEILQARRRECRATVALLVDARGPVREAKVETGSGGDRFDRAALRAARGSRYGPGWVECEPADPGDLPHAAPPRPGPRPTPRGRVRASMALRRSGFTSACAAPDRAMLQAARILRFSAEGRSDPVWVPIDPGYGRR